MLSEICGFRLFCLPSAGSNARAISGEEGEEGEGKGGVAINGSVCEQYIHGKWSIRSWQQVLRKQEGAAGKPSQYWVLDLWIHFHPFHHVHTYLW